MNRLKRIGTMAFAVFVGICSTVAVFADVESTSVLQ